MFIAGAKDNPRHYVSRISKIHNLTNPVFEFLRVWWQKRDITFIFNIAQFPL
jgi:hypothetical protein